MSKFYDAIMGLVVGDALGVPFEFRMRDTFKAAGMTGFGTYNQPAGTWSDDSSMTLATIESLRLLGKLDFNDIMHNFYRWLFHGEFTPYGHTFDFGNTTKNAIQKYKFDNAKPLRCGGDSVRDNGNGSLMRILPIAFVKHCTKDIHDLSSLTHAHDISKFACVFYVNVAKNLLQGKSKFTAIYDFDYEIPEEFNRIQILERLSRDDIKSTGYVVDTLEAALWCLIHTESYKECVLTAVNLGGDTDTIAAVVGGLAGIYYGIGGKRGIPEEWISQIARKEWIKELCDAFENKHSINRKG